MPDKLKVAFDARSLTAPALRGWDRYTLGLAQALIAAGVEVTFVHKAGEAPRAEYLRGMRLDCLPIAANRGLFWEQVALPRALHEHGFDLYHAPAEHGIPLLAPCPTVLTVHSVISYSYRELVRSGTLPGTLTDYIGYEFSDLSLRVRYWRAEIARASALLVPSEYCRSELTKQLRIGPSRVQTTPLALASDFLRPPKSAEERRAVLAGLGIEPPYLLYVGGYEKHKNPHGLLRLFAALAPKRRKLSLVMVGSRSVPESLSTLAEDLGVAGRVISLANVSGSLVDLYDGAALFVSMSWLETFCLPALEAMSRGLLTVTTAWGALPEVVGDAGWLVDPRDITAAAATVAKALDAPDHNQRRTRGKQRVALFNWDKTASLTLQVYEALLREGHPRQRGAA